MRRRVQQREADSCQHVSDHKSWPISAPRGQACRDPHSGERRGKLHGEKQSRLRVAQIPSRNKCRQDRPRDDRRESRQNKSSRKQARSSPTCLCFAFAVRASELAITLRIQTQIDPPRDHPTECHSDRSEPTLFFAFAPANASACVVEEPLFDCHHSSRAIHRETAIHFEAAIHSGIEAISRQRRQNHLYNRSS